LLRWEQQSIGDGYDDHYRKLRSPVFIVDNDRDSWWLNIIHFQPLIAAVRALSVIRSIALCVSRSWSAWLWTIINLESPYRHVSDRAGLLAGQGGTHVKRRRISAEIDATARRVTSQDSTELLLLLLSSALRHRIEASLTQTTQITVALFESAWQNIIFLYDLKKKFYLV